MYSSFRLIISWMLLMCFNQIHPCFLTSNFYLSLLPRFFPTSSTLFLCLFSRLCCLHQHECTDISLGIWVAQKLLWGCILEVNMNELLPSAIKWQELLRYLWEFLKQSLNHIGILARLSHCMFIMLQSCMLSQLLFAR